MFVGVLSLFSFVRLSGCHHLDNFEAMDSVVLSLEVIEGDPKEYCEGLLCSFPVGVAKSNYSGIKACWSTS